MSTCIASRPAHFRLGLALLSVVVLTGCDAGDADPTPTPSGLPSINAASLLSEIECATGLTDGVSRPSEMVVLQDGTPLIGEAPAEPLPSFDVEEVIRAPLPDSATPIAAVLCTAVYVAGDGYAGFAIRAYDDLDQLTATLRTAQLPAPTEEDCPDIIDRAPNLWVVTQDGTLLAPAWPADGCGHYTRPTPESVLTEPALAPIDLEAIAPLP
jgi:hypothetical protein